MKKIGEIRIEGTPDDAVALLQDVARDMGLEVHVVDDGGKGDSDGTDLDQRRRNARA